MPDDHVLPTWATLEALPYFSACLTEGKRFQESLLCKSKRSLTQAPQALRFSYGTVSRSPRVSHNRTYEYCGYRVPPGTPISTQTYSMHHHEDVFPDSWTFRPERWLNEAVGPDGVKPLSRYMVAFGRGTRSCVGVNLAYAMLHHMLPMMFRNFDFELYDTTREAVDCYSTALGPLPKQGTKGVRVFVK